MFTAAVVKTGKHTGTRQTCSQALAGHCSIIFISIFYFRGLNVSKLQYIPVKRTPQQTLSARITVENLPTPLLRCDRSEILLAMTTPRTPHPHLYPPPRVRFDKMIL